jgi:hypothetical protein
LTRLENNFKALATADNVIRVLATKNQVVLKGCLPELIGINEQTGIIGTINLVFAREDYSSSSSSSSSSPISNLG